MVHWIKQVSDSFTKSISPFIAYFVEQEGKPDGIQELQNKILEVLRQEPYMGEKIPVR